VKILKAHALERLDKTEEALALCAEVQAKNPTDDAVLSTMLLVYKHAGASDEAIICYENAVKLQPGNEERAKG
jgi:tetratricopeptide (TPR) repeat protein